MRKDILATGNPGSRLVPLYDRIDGTEIRSGKTKIDFVSDSNLITGQYLQPIGALYLEEANHQIVLVLRSFLQENFFNLPSGLGGLPSIKEGHSITPTVHSFIQGKDISCDKLPTACFKTLPAAKLTPKTPQIANSQNSNAATVSPSTSKYSKLTFHFSGRQSWACC